MKSLPSTLLLFVLAAFACSPALQAQDHAAAAPVSAASAMDTAFQNFWAADSPAAAAGLAEQIGKMGVTFDEAWRRLKAGRTYTPQSSGIFLLSDKAEDGVEYYFSVNIPANYDPSRRYQVRFQLHGGVSRRTNNRAQGNGSIGQLAGAEQIYVLPYAWNERPWWHPDQALNMDAIVDTLKRTYNVDENRVVLSGVSDGGTGTYYLAMQDTTPFASFLPLIGYVMVLGNVGIDEGRIFPNNLLNKPMFVVNDGQDPLYPTHIVEPFIRHLMASGVSIDYHPQPDGVHNTAWWPDVESIYEKFVTEHPRDPNPARLTWEATKDTNHRAHWLVIDEFGSASGEAKQMPDANVVTPAEQTIYSETRGLMFQRPDQTGRVDVVRSGNTVQATTRGVSAFTLLLSPDVFDFNQPVKVIANGRTVFNARVQRSTETLLKWAARDNDRTMLYGAELHIKLNR